MDSHHKKVRPYYNFSEQLKLQLLEKLTPIGLIAKIDKPPLSKSETVLDEVQYYIDQLSGVSIDQYLNSPFVPVIMPSDRAKQLELLVTIDIIIERFEEYYTPRSLITETGSAYLLFYSDDEDVVMTIQCQTYNGRLTLSIKGADIIINGFKYPKLPELKTREIVTAYLSLSRSQIINADHMLKHALFYMAYEHLQQDMSDSDIDALMTLFEDDKPQGSWATILDSYIYFENIPLHNSIEILQKALQKFELVEFLNTEPTKNNHINPDCIFPAFGRMINSMAEGCRQHKASLVVYLSSIMDSVQLINTLQSTNSNKEELLIIHKAMLLANQLESISIEHDFSVTEYPTTVTLNSL